MNQQELHDAALKKFRDDKYGLFLHYGPFAMTGRCEWTYNLDDFTPDEFAEFAAKFNPKNCDPKKWVAFAKEVGMKYCVLTSRHHDGYCLWDTKTHDFNSVKGTPHRDLVKEFTDACREAGMGVGIYYSLVDWRYKWAWQDDDASKERMLAMVHEQVRELMTNYGRVDILWFDGNCEDRVKTTAQFWRSEELMQMVHELQPGILINNRSGLPGDFGTPERQIVPEKDRAWESCLTMDPISWSNVPYSPNRKTAANLIGDMTAILCGGGNLLLNVGPEPNGDINRDEQAAIREAGKWYAKYKDIFTDSVPGALDDYGSAFSAGSCEARWVASPDPKVQYIITKCWTGKEFWFPRVGGEPVEITLLPEGKKVDFHFTGFHRLVLTGLPEEAPDPYATVFKVVFKDAPSIIRMDDKLRGTL